MARVNGTTTQRGYGSQHQAERERRLTVYRPGDICAHGGEPLHYWPLATARRYLDLPHAPGRNGYLPGLSCRRHNRSEGASRGNRMGPLRGRARQIALAAGQPLTTWRRARDW